MNPNVSWSPDFSSKSTTRSDFSLVHIQGSQLDMGGYEKIMSRITISKNNLDSQYYPDKLKNMFNTPQVALKQTGWLHLTFG